ncbi:IPT/TIG domain-containing protein [Cellulomonas sp. ICMP 17802]|uniref:IPT/TIG domain-containing protein n=1 Tax=Cellulomonas sp. ICMP 17802 TaxID=3239199 RepID=UPI00351B872B
MTVRRSSPTRMRLRAAQAVVGIAALVAAGLTAAPASATAPGPVVAQAVAPAVSSLSPARGHEYGGTRVTIRGTGLDSVTAVWFGGYRTGTSLEIVSSTELQVTTPRWGVGPWPVTLESPAGTVAAGTFTYEGTQFLAPTRVLDDPDVRPNERRCFVVPALASLPPTAAVAIINVTAVHPSGPGFATVYLGGLPPGAFPSAATVNFEPGRDVATTSVVNAFTPGGELCYGTGGAEHVGLKVDLVGYSTASIAATDWSYRLLDTRTAGGQVTGPVKPRTVYTIDVAGLQNVPEDATAVLLTVGVVGGGTGNLRVFPAGEAVPTASVVNYAAGVDKSNSTLVGLPESGQVSFWSDTDRDVDVVVDVIGWTRTPPAALHTVTPSRVVDTRPGPAHVGPLDGALPGQQIRSVPLRGVGSVPADATAVVLNVTAIGPAGPGNLRVYADADGSGATRPPGTSWINYIPGRDVPNMVVVDLPENGRVDFYSDTFSGPVDVAVDVLGYLVAG